MQAEDEERRKREEEENERREYSRYVLMIIAWEMCFLGNGLYRNEAETERK